MLREKVSFVFRNLPLGCLWLVHNWCNPWRIGAIKGKRSSGVLFWVDKNAALLYGLNGDDKYDFWVEAGIAMEIGHGDSSAVHRLTSSFADEIRELKTQFDVFRYMKRITENYGSKAFMVLNVPNATTSQLAKSSIITNLAADFTIQYDKHFMLEHSSVLKHLRQSTLPFQYDVESDKFPGDKAIADLAIQFHVPRGVYLCAHDRLGNRAAVGFFGERPLFSMQELLELQMISVHVYDRMAIIKSADEQPREALSDRELDCLNWTAAGKTSVEIAEIVGLSEHTVNHYLNRATKKLDTVNRTQAVAKALRTGLIT